MVENKKCEKNDEMPIFADSQQGVKTFSEKFFTKPGLMYLVTIDWFLTTEQTSFYSNWKIKWQKYKLDSNHLIMWVFPALVHLHGSSKEDNWFWKKNTDKTSLGSSCFSFHY